jgi:hypothetical protein
VQNALVRECLNEARDCIDINRDGNILFKPRGDPDPIPPINLANFSARRTQVLEEPTSATPTPTATHKHATPAPSPSTSPAVAIKGAETNASPAMGWPAEWVARWLLHWLVISTTGIAPVARSGGHSSRLIRPCDYFDIVHCVARLSWVAASTIGAAVICLKPPLSNM